MSRVKQITKEEVMHRMFENEPVYILKRLSQDSTFADAINSDAFVVLEEDSNEGISEETDTEDVSEEVEGDTEAVISKRKEEKPVKKKKPKKASAKKQIDHGKIIACRRAGWSVAKIADEIGCNPQTVYNHLAKEGMK